MLWCDPIYTAATGSTSTTSSFHPKKHRKEIAEIVKNRIDSSGLPSLIASQAITDAEVSTNQPWEQNSANITTYLAMEQPSINQIQKRINRAQATAATTNQTAMVYYTFVGQHTILSYTWRQIFNHNTSRMECDRFQY